MACEGVSGRWPEASQRRGSLLSIENLSANPSGRLLPFFAALPSPSFLAFFDVLFSLFNQVLAFGSVFPVLSQGSQGYPQRNSAGHPYFCTATIAWTCPVCPAILPNLIRIAHKAGRDVADVLGFAPRTVPGTLPRHNDHQIPSCVLYQFFLLPTVPILALSVGLPCPCRNRAQHLDCLHRADSAPASARPGVLPWKSSVFLLCHLCLFCCAILDESIEDILPNDWGWRYNPCLL